MIKNNLYSLRNENAYPYYMWVILFLLSSYSTISFSDSCESLPSDYSIYSGSQIELKDDIKVNGNTVSGTHSPNVGISPDGTVTTNLNPTLPSLEPASFPSNTESRDEESSSNIVIDGASEVYYDEIKLQAKSKSITFTGSGPFHIKKLITEKEKSTINFSAGIYYINELNLKDEKTTINISSGPVFIHVGTKFNIEKGKVDVNKNGSVDNFVVYLHTDATFSAEDEKLDFTGVIYGPNSGEVKFSGEKIKFDGTIITGGKVTIEKEDFELTLTPSEQTAINGITICTSTPEPIAIWRMDEASWDGSSNEVIDETGNGHHGTAFNGATTQNTSPAISGNPGSCGYGEFDGSDDYIALPNIPNLQGSFTITAWIKGDSGVDGRIFADDDKNEGGYALSLGDGGHGKLRFFSRNVNPVVLDTGNVIPNKNKWYFVTAVHDVSTKQRFIYVDGIEKASGTYTGTWGIDSGIASIGGETNASSEGAHFATFSGNIDEVQVFESALSQAQIQTIMAEIHPCNITTLASNFKCVNTASNPVTGRLFTKLANTSFTLDVVALQDANTVASGYSNTVTVELVDASSGSCASHSVLNPEINQSLTFLSATGVETSSNMTSTKAYRNLKCRVTDSVTALVGCSTDAFAIRPENFTITSPLNNTGDSGSPVETAGTTFNITAETGIVNYDGNPVIDSAQLTAHVDFVQTGILAGLFPAADPSTGNSTGSSFTYSEVGNVLLNAGAIIDSDFATIDKSAGDCISSASNTVDIDGKIGCNIANTNLSTLGRFIPDHFEISISNNGSFGGSTYACSGFNYFGQTFSYDTKPQLTVTAYNGLSPKEITQNYAGNYAKLAIGDFDFDIPTTDANKLGADSINKVNLIWTPAAPDMIDNNNGSLSLTLGDDTFKYPQKTNSLVAPFTNSVEFNFIDITDSDGVASNNLPLSLTPSGAIMRFGRLSIANSHGSELVPLSAPVTTEYFNGTNWTLNSIDSCTNLDLANNITLSNPASGNNRPGDTAMVIESATSTASLLNSPFSSGQGNLSFSAPGEDNQGYIDIKGSLAGFEWLQFDWNSDGNFNENPSGRASFGLFTGSDKLIFRREVY